MPSYFVWGEMLNHHTHLNAVGCRLSWYKWSNEDSRPSVDTVGGSFPWCWPWTTLRRAWCQWTQSARYMFFTLSSLSVYLNI